MDKNITYEKLKSRFRERKLQNYGLVIIVPGDKFDPDWEAKLEDCSCIEEKYYGKPVVLIKRAEKPKAVAGPQELLLLKSQIRSLYDLAAELRQELASVKEEGILKQMQTDLECTQVIMNRIKQLEKHEHAASGKVMIPLKAEK